MSRARRPVATRRTRRVTPALRVDSRAPASLPRPRVTPAPPRDSRTPA
jgi:hypothetical protein